MRAFKKKGPSDDDCAVDVREQEASKNNGDIVKVSKTSVDAKLAVEFLVFVGKRPGASLTRQRTSHPMIVVFMAASKPSRNFKYKKEVDCI